MQNNVERDVWLIGAGPIACEYAKVLLSMRIPFTVIGRRGQSLATFKKETGICGIPGGLNKWLGKKPDAPVAAIVAACADQLSSVTIDLVKYGVSNILVEKPAGLNEEQINNVFEETKKANAAVYVAYNRHFYSSVLKLKELMLEDGGVTSFNFEFTEWSHQIESLDIQEEIKHSWFLANSSHVVDLAFFLGGRPIELACYTAGSLNWHPISIYSGAGISERGALFSYSANWASPGRWSVEILTGRHRFILRPLEKLQVQNIGSLESEYVAIDDKLDIDFKPGFYRQVGAFIGGNREGLLTLKEHLMNLEYYKMINRTRTNENFNDR